MEAVKGLGILLALYGVYGMAKGQVYSKDGMSSRYVFRDEEPVSFWTVCLCYVIGGALVFWVI